MKRSKILFGIFVFGCLLGLRADLPAADERPATQPAWGDDKDGYRIGIAVEPSECTVGEPLVLKITFENLGEQMVLSGPGALIEYDVVVTRRDGSRAPFTSYGEYVRSPAHVLEFWDRVLKRGESDQLVVQLNRCVDMTFAAEYKIHVERKMPSRKRPDDSVIVSSKEISVTLREPTLQNNDKDGESQHKNDERNAEGKAEKGKVGQKDK